MRPALAAALVLVTALTAADLPHHRGPQQDGNFPGPFAVPATKLAEHKLGTGIAGAVIAVGGLLYAGTDDGRVLALNPSDLSTVWEVKIDGGVAGAPGSLPGRILIASGAGTVQSLDPLSGAEQWKAQVGGEIVGGLNAATLPDGSGVVVVGSHDYSIYGFNAADGSKRFQVETGERINGAPAVSGTLALAGGCDAAVHIVDCATNGHRAIGLPEFIPGSVSVAGGDVLAAYGNPNGPMTLACVDIATDTVRWEYAGDSSMPGSAAATAERVVIALNDGFLACLDRTTGTEIWKKELDGPVSGSPLIVDGTVLIGTESGTLLAHALTDGTERWRYTIGPPIYGSPVLIDGRLYIGDSDGNLLVFGAP